MGMGEGEYGDGNAGGEYGEGKHGDGEYGGIWGWDGE
jgi:hypothetical protein